MSAASGDADSGIRVVVTPSQSSYFAGEPFSVKITFTNTRSPSSPPLRTQSHTHKRGAHSISSAPLARPPTSPGTPRTAVHTVTARTNNGGTKIARRGFIGKSSSSNGTDKLPEGLEQSRKRLLAKSRSLSVTLAPHEVPQESQKESAAHIRAHDEIISPGSTPASPQVQSPFGRSPTLPPNHPHARKHSVLDGQVQLPEMQQQSPVTSSASNSTFSLSLDPISESMSSPFPTSVPATPTSGPYMNGQQRRPSQLGLGHPGGPLHFPPRTAFSSMFPHTNTELILYAYAHLTGTLSMTPIPSTATTPDQASTLNSLRFSLLKRSVIGGGSMDITSSLHSNHQRIQLGSRRQHRRSSSFSSGLLSFISAPSPPPSAPNLTSFSTPALLPPSQSWSASHHPRTQAQSRVPSPSPSSTSSGLLNGNQVGEEIDPEIPLPTFEVPQVMLAVDLSLGPGESRTYTYSLPLPDNLPPTFKGRSLKFSYQLVVGICRAGSSPASPVKAMGPTGANSVSRVMNVPVRVYNNVFVGRPQRPYDLLWPVARRRTFAVEHGAKVTEEFGRHAKAPAAIISPTSPSPNLGTFEDLRDYARRLLSSFQDPVAPGVPMKLPAEVFSPVRSNLERELERELEGGLTGCREAVEILTRNPKKVSYDVNKDGVRVAVLTFTKSAYRLGETVLGVVELNERTSQARVLSLSAMLEAQESLPSSISPPSGARQMHRVHAEHHSSFVHSSLRTTFALDIPSDASPAFQVKIGDATHVPAPTGGLEWKVRLCLLVAVAAESSDPGPQGVRMKHLLRNGPRGEWGSSWKASASIAPMERPNQEQKEQQATQTQTWGQFFSASFLSASEPEYDTDDDEDRTVTGEGMWDGDGEAQRDFGGGNEGWKDIKVETVECEVPIKVWPGNTAFKATDVVFDV